MMAHVVSKARPAAFTACRAAVSTQTRGLKVGIIGAGRIGRVHLETLASVPGVQPVIISDVVESVLKDVTATYGVPKYTMDANEVIHHPDVEAVWICSPSQFHADQIKTCAKAGKHIFCEKPIATDLAGTIEAIKVAKDCGVKLMTAFQRRFDPSFARLQKVIAAGEVGKPVSAVLQSRDPGAPPFAYVKGGGGLFKDMAIHDLDIARWLMGSCGKNEPVQVYATGACNVDQAILELKGSNPSEAIDTANILVEFESGSTATIQVCRKATYGYDQRVEFFGTEGLVKHDNVFPNTVSVWDGKSVRHADAIHNFFMTRYADAYKNETKAFCEILKSGGEVSPSGDDGRAALEMAMACDKSLKEGRPVKISEVQLK
ncbi:oxidoreductase [Tribonema minus]|uniref:Oxidoreductase n=1 Tax=Tribonema minus TaxID=303371 RepID=A0A835Z516_9STRA|nr:oxidoreductase [Tribonema minus]